MITIYFKDLNKAKQIEIIDEVGEEYVANIEPLAIISLDNIDNTLSTELKD
jgi:hypothetical protein